MKVGAVLTNEHRHERIARATAAPAMRALTKRRGLELVVDIPDHSPTLGVKQFEDFGFVCAQHVK